MSQIMRNHAGDSARREQPSRVLLVCVYDTVILEITNETIYERFCRHGSVIKILIFERGEVTKFFIQFSTVSQAQKAKETLDGSKLYDNICKMNIYFSNFSNVDLRHETTEGADFALREEIKNYFTSTYDSLSRQTEHQPEMIDQDPFIMEAFKNTHDSHINKEEFIRSVTNNKCELEVVLPRSKTQDLDLRQHCRLVNQQYHERVQDFIEHSINSLLDSNESEKQRKLRPQPLINSKYPPLLAEADKAIKPALIQGMPIPPLPAINGNIRIRDPISNSFLWFHADKQLPIRNIYNLFSNFGNVSFINRTKDTVFIKFRTVQFAAIANNYLRGCELMGVILDLSVLDDETKGYPRQQQYSQCTYFDESFDRFTSQKSITINPPSRTLHVSSIRREVCRVDSLKRVFGEHGQVQAVQILHQSSEKNMALVKFYTIEDSFYAISELHNTLLNGRKIQISFTKSKLI